MVLNYLFNILIATDELANTILGGNPHETISARLGREYPNSFTAKVVDFLFGTNHCKSVAQNGDGGKELIGR
jgi:hypothetical protein